MATTSFTTTGPAPAATQTISAAPPPHRHHQFHHQHEHLQLQQQQQHHHHQQEQEQHHLLLQQQQQDDLQHQQQAFLNAGPSDQGGTGRNNGNNNSLNLGLGFLRGLGLERKTNRDGQTPKRRGPKPDSKPALTRRQELNRQAQRTHRQRKEVYIKSLEDQVMQLKELYAAQVQETGSVDEENRKLKELLQLHGIQVPGDLPQRGGPAPQQQQQVTGDGSFPTNFSASDGGFGGQSSDYATPSSYQASGSDAGGPTSAISAASDGTLQQQQQQHLLLHRQQQQQQQQLQQQQQPQHQHQPHSPMATQMLQDQLMQGNAEENQLGIDFVLALEAFCRDHQQYLCVRSSQSIESAEPVASGHALMLSCPPASHIERTPDDPYPHRAPAGIPSASLASLLRSARQLPLVGDGELTPVMALNLIQTDDRFPSMTVREFVAVQKELEEKTRCYGFGAVLEEFEVRDALENLFSGRVPPA